MEHLIPVFVAGAWPITFLVVFLVAIFYLPIKSIVRTVDKRISEGASFEIPRVMAVGANANIDRPAPFSRGSGDSTNGTSANVESVELASAVFHGVRLEIRLNQEVAESMLGDLERLSRGKGLIPLRRLNEMAAAAFIQRPLVPLDDPIINFCWIYLQEIRIFNRLVDSIDNPSAPDDYARARISQALTFRDRLKKSGSELLAALEAMPSPPTK